VHDICLICNKKALKHTNKIYLAGGLSSDWRQKVIKTCEGNFIFFNPKEHGLETHDPSQYTAWDLYHIKNCDILFGYMEKENKSGYGLSLEIGYAHALGKTIILVDERSQHDDWFETKYNIVRNTSNVNLDNLEDGIKFLNSFSKKEAIFSN